MTKSIRTYIIATLFAIAAFAMTAFAQNAQEAEALAIVNQIRVANGLSEVRFDAALENGSAVRANEITTSFSHTRPDGSAWWTVDDSLMYGENLAEGYDSAQDVVNAWMASPSHAENILKADFTTCAITMTTSSNGKVYWAQEFGIA